MLCNAAGTAVLVLLILACLPLTLPRLAGYRLYTVISGSMEPEIPVDSLVLVRGADGLPALVSRNSENLFDMVERMEAGDDGG